MTSPCGAKNVKKGLRKHDDKEEPIPSLSGLHLTAETPI